MVEDACGVVSGLDVKVCEVDHEDEVELEIEVELTDDEGLELVEEVELVV